MISSCTVPEPDPAWDNKWEAELYPAEHVTITDSISGTKLIYVTSGSKFFSALSQSADRKFISGTIRSEAPDSRSVEFTSHKREKPDVCIAYLPEAWNEPFMESDTSCQAATE